MKPITYDEQQLMAIFNSDGTRAGLIAELETMREELTPEDKDLEALTDSALEKLRSMSDEDFARMDLFPDFSGRIVNVG